MKPNLIFKICCAIVVIAPFVVYSSLVIPEGVFKPELFGVPYTLWLGVSIIVFLWIVTFVAVANHPLKGK